MQKIFVVIAYFSKNEYIKYNIKVRVLISLKLYCPTQHQISRLNTHALNIFYIASV